MNLTMFPPPRVAQAAKPRGAKIVLLYDSFATAVRGQAFCDQLAGQLEAGGDPDESRWRSGHLSVPAIRHEAARAARRADFVVLSLRGDAEFSDALSQWCREWMPAATDREITLALLHDPATAPQFPAESVRSYLQDAAQVAGVRFFAHPANPAGAPSDRAPSFAAAIVPSSHRARALGATILVVDDNVSLRELVARSLNGAGHRTLLAHDGAEAQRVIEENASGIDLVVTDIEMPRLRGDDLAAWMGRAHPAIQVLLMSSAMPEAPGTKELPFLEKPFRLDALVSTVRELLGQAARR